MFDRAHVDSTGRTAAGPLNHYSQTETAVGLGCESRCGENCTQRRRLVPCAWMAELRSGHCGLAQPSTRLGLVVMGLTLLCSLCRSRTMIDIAIPSLP